jgi:hypothetical protein
LFPGTAVAGRICTGTADDVSFVIQKTPCVVRPGTTVTGVATGNHDTVSPTAVALDALGGTVAGDPAETAGGGVVVAVVGGVVVAVVGGVVVADVAAPAGELTARATGPRLTASAAAARATAARAGRRRTAERGWAALSTSSSRSSPA